MKRLRSNRYRYPRAFTWVELLVVIAIIGVLAGLLFPSMRVSREAARRMSCSNQFQTIGIAMHAYHAAYKHLPSAMAGTNGGDATQSNQGRLSGWVAMLPFLEQQRLWNRISSPSKNTHGKIVPAMGPAPWVKTYDPWRTQIPLLACPSSPSQGNGFGMTNIAFCIGDLARTIHQPATSRGMFACGRAIRLDEVTDGLSDTIAMTEIGTLSDRSLFGQYAVTQNANILAAPRLCQDLRDTENPGSYRSDVSLSDLGRGGRWCDGSAGFTLANTILPPNAASGAVAGQTAADGIYSAGSFHQGGCHVLMGDGRVVFMTASIDVGDLQQASLTAEEMIAQPQSPYGLWGALGTRAASETIEEQINQ